MHMRLLRLRVFLIAGLAIYVGAFERLDTLFKEDRSESKLSSTTDYCSADLNSSRYPDVELNCDDNDNITDKETCDVKNTRGGCSVQELTCVNGSFSPPRAACKENQCDNWTGSDRSAAFGKIAELDEALSYVHQDEAGERHVQLVVYINKLWDDENSLDINLYLTEPGKETPIFEKKKRAVPQNGWEEYDSIPEYLKDGVACVKAYRLQKTWEEWVKELSTEIVDHNDKQVNLNQLRVKITSKEGKDYTAWDPRLLPAGGTGNERAFPSMEQEIEEKLNVVIEYPSTVVTSTQNFKLTDQENVDVQIEKFKISDMKFLSDKTKFTLELDMESQVQAPFKLESMSMIGAGLCFSPDGKGACEGSKTKNACNGNDASNNSCIWRGLDVEEKATNIQATEDCTNADGSGNQRLWKADGKEVRICSQSWTVTLTIETRGCEIPNEFGFEWDLRCIDGSAADTDCPLTTETTHLQTLSGLVSSPDLLWICPHMVSEHPVWTTFRTYRKDPQIAREAGGDPEQEQSMFKEEKEVYAEIQLDSAWGFLDINSIAINTFNIEYDRDPQHRANPSIGGSCGRCVTKDGMQDPKQKCEKQKKGKECTDITEFESNGDLLCDWTGDDYGQAEGDKCIYKLYTNNVRQDSLADLVSLNMETRKEKGYVAKDDAAENRSRYVQALHFVLEPKVFPQPYYNCATKASNEESYETEGLLGDDCDFTKGEMVFLVELEVDYLDAGRRRRAIVSHKSHSSTAVASTTITIESTAEAAYEEELDIQAVRHFAAVRKGPSSKQNEVLTQEDEPTGGGGNHNIGWQIPLGTSLGVLAVMLLLIWICWLHKCERASDKKFDESMAGLLERYPREEKHVEQTRDYGRSPDMDKDLENVEEEPRRNLDKEEDVEETPLDCVTNGDSIMVPVPHPTSPRGDLAVTFGGLVGLEDAPDLDDLPPVPDRRRPGVDSTAANSTRGTILHALSAHQSVASCRSVASEGTQMSRPGSCPTQNPRTDTRSCHTAHSSTKFSAASNVMRAASTTSRFGNGSSITSKARTVRSVTHAETATMSTCTGYGADNPINDAPV